jgi:hypothetical protein
VLRRDAPGDDSRPLGIVRQQRNHRVDEQVGALLRPDPCRSSRWHISRATRRLQSRRRARCGGWKAFRGRPRASPPGAALRETRRSGQAGRDHRHPCWRISHLVKGLWSRCAAEVNTSLHLRPKAPASGQARRSSLTLRLACQMRLRPESQAAATAKAAAAAASWAALSGSPGPNTAMPRRAACIGTSCTTVLVTPEQPLLEVRRDHLDARHVDRAGVSGAGPALRSCLIRHRHSCSCCRSDEAQLDDLVAARAARAH